MGVIDTVKDIGVLIQKLDNVEVVKRLVELQQQVYEVVSENRDLKERNRELTEKLATRAQMAFRKNAYWKGEEGPFCSRCYDGENLLVRLHTSQIHTPVCPKCHSLADDPDRQPVDSSGGGGVGSPWG